MKMLARSVTALTWLFVKRSKARPQKPQYRDNKQTPKTSSPRLVGGLIPAVLCTAFLAWAPASQAENPFIYYYHANSATVQGASKEDVCQNIFPKLFHPELNWRNTRFNRWSPGAARYSNGAWGFECIGDNDTWTDDVRSVGSVYCGNEYVDLQDERCVCAPGTMVIENGFCVAPSNSTCTLVLDGVCHGGKNNGSCETDGQPSVGNPCNPANGNKFNKEPLYQGQAGFKLDLSYNTQDEESAARFGLRWRDTFDRRITIFGSTAVAFRPDGRGLRFPASGGVWVADADTKEVLTELKDPLGTRVGWQLYVARGDETETYDATGRLLQIVSRNGLTQTLVYTDGTSGSGGGFALDNNGQPTTMVLPAGLLLRVADPFGRSLMLGYNVGLRVSRLTDPAGGIYQFTYDANKRLTSVTFPGENVRSYHYNEAANTAGTVQTLALTGITDENGQRFATYQYDTKGRAVTTERAGGANRHTLAYDTNGTTNVTSPLGAVRTYSFQNLFGALKNTTVTGAACPECGPATQTFDANGNVASRTDWNGNRTNYAYDLARNLETSRTEGLTSSGGTTPQTRTISTQWHALFRLPTSIAEPLRITSFVYDADGTQCGARGALCSRTIQATTDVNGAQGFSATAASTPRTWSYTYNARGRLLTADGPRTDVADTTTYTYYPDDDPDLGKRGNIATITNAAGHLASVTVYDAHGQPLAIVDPNGINIALTYDTRQRLKTRTVGAETTTYDYDGVGKLTKVTLPHGSFLSYDYDAAHRLTAITDNLGNRVVYTLDAMGNRTQEQVFDPANQLAQTRSRVFNDLSRLFRELGAQDQTTEYTYDDQGNVITVKDPLDRTTTNQYDALNRLKQVTSPAPISAVTQYAYNGIDALTRVTDPRGLATDYIVDGLGNLNQQASPDTGTTVNTYDDAGNLLTQRDAKNQTTTYAYDALNRVALITFHDGSKQTYAYDQGTNAIGRLFSITETNASNQVTSAIAYAYDQHGRVTSERRTMAGVQYVFGYRYDSFGRLDQLTYPSGRIVNYAFDGLGRVNAVTTTKAGQQAQNVVTGVTYHPFGGVSGYTLGNGQVYTRGIDLDGRIASYTLGTQHFAIGYDAASRIEFISDIGTPANTNTYVYDELDRLTGAVLPGTPYAYTYDAVGNRTSRTAGSSTDTYVYSSISNRIASITPTSGPVRSFVFDPNGSTTADGVNTYVYDTRGRMVQATSSIGATNYEVNALGQRIRKTNSQTDRVFHYDIQGKLIAETSPSGVLRRELIYLGDMPAGVVQ